MRGFTEEFENCYLDWMIELINGPEDALHYCKLINYLYETEFYSNNQYDANRIEDVYTMREEYIESDECTAEEIPFNVIRDMPSPSVFEVLVAMARRIDSDIMYDIRYGDRTAQWFWTMMDNLGLTSEDDSEFNERYVKQVVTKFLNRQYRNGGKGALFPVPDAADLDIWGQMGEWFAEKM